MQGPGLSHINPASYKALPPHSIFRPPPRDPDRPLWHCTAGQESITTIIMDCDQSSRGFWVEGLLDLWDALSAEPFLNASTTSAWWVSSGCIYVYQVIRMIPSLPRYAQFYCICQLQQLLVTLEGHWISANGQSLFNFGPDGFRHQFFCDVPCNWCIQCVKHPC